MSGRGAEKMEPNWESEIEIKKRAEMAIVMATGEKESCERVEAPQTPKGS